MNEFARIKAGSKLFFYAIIVVWLCFGCAATYERSLTIEQVGSDVWLVDILSGAQSNAQDSVTTVGFDPTALSELPGIDITSNGLLSIDRIVIQDVEGSVYIEQFGVGSQNVDAVRLMREAKNPFKEN